MVIGGLIDKLVRTDRHTERCFQLLGILWHGRFDGVFNGEGFGEIDVVSGDKSGGLKHSDNTAEVSSGHRVLSKA